MSALRFCVHLSIAVAAALATLDAQNPREPPGIPPIPAAEQVREQPGLRVRLTMRRRSLAAFEDPRFVVTLENVGTRPLRLNPYTAPGIRIYDEKGLLVEPLMGAITERAFIEIGNEDLRQIDPGATWAIAMPPHYPQNGTSTDAMRWYQLSDAPGEFRFALPAGQYTARFTYLNFPSFSAHYDMGEVTDIWEGRVESAPVAFSVAAGAETDLVEFAESVAPPPESQWAATATIDELEQRLSTDNYHEFRIVVDQLLARASTRSMPILRELIGSDLQWKRSIAALGLARLGGPDAAALMRMLIDHDDRDVAGHAIGYLSEHCAREDAPLFERKFREGFVAAAVAGLRRCGDAANFRTLRGLDDAADMTRALHELTFTAVPLLKWTWQPFSPQEWDDWWATHRTETRVDWAMRALSAPPVNGSFHQQALEYLRLAGDRRALPVLHRIASGGPYYLRIAAAHGVAALERDTGIALLRRDLLNRHPDAFRRALDALNAVTGEDLEFDFTVPSERRRAFAAFAPRQ